MQIFEQKIKFFNKINDFFQAFYMGNSNSTLNPCFINDEIIK